MPIPGPSDTPNYPPLLAGFLGSLARFPTRLAIEVEGSGLTYADLADMAGRCAALLQEADSGSVPLTAVFGQRSKVTFVGVLAALYRGHGYVPLNPTFPIERTRAMLERAGCRAMVVDAEAARQLPMLLEGWKTELVVLLPEAETAADLMAAFPNHRFLTATHLRTAVPLAPVTASPESVAYVLFTSGSTGVPKGVMVSRHNVAHYVHTVVDRYAISEHDRCSQTFELTFDLAMHDLFVAWERGACVCCPSRRALLKPGRFIRDAGLTIWFSVPSLAMFMRQFGELKPGQYPGLRLSLFCGEALPVDLTLAWAAAAPQSVVENIYGPTEATIACTGYRWKGESSVGECEHGVVPIGFPFRGMEARVVDEHLREVELGQEGELLMCGPQVALGYLNDPQKTAQAFVFPPGEHRRFYRTGDRVRQGSQGAPLTYLGRMDHQVKILGHRVELGEIESVVRSVTGLDGVVALGWPLHPGGAGGVEVFLQLDAARAPDEALLKERVASRLPAYMVPRRFHLLPTLPLNANGKFDRPALLKRLESHS